MKNLILKTIITLSIVLNVSLSASSTPKIPSQIMIPTAPFQKGSGGAFGTSISTSDGPAYYNRCVLSVHAKKFGKTAMDGGYYGLNPTKEKFKEMEETLKEAVEEATIANVSNIKDSFAQLKTYLLKTKKMKAQEATKMKVQENDLRMEYKAMLKKEVEKAKSTSFGDTDKNATPQEGSFTYKMMKNLCKRTKMNEKALGKDARVKDNEASSKKAKKNVSKRQKVTSLKSERRKSQDKHYDLFCTPEEQKQDLCEVASALPNGDLQADLFLYPMGFNEENEAVSDFNTKYTYNETEALAADSFIQNIIGFMPVEPPSPEERSNPDKAKFVTLYNQLVSSLNLSSYIFEKSYQRRLPKNKDGVRMSEIDILKYMVDDLKNPDNQAMENQARGSGFEMIYQSANVLKTKIDMEKLTQKERLKLLEATILSLGENSAELLQYLESRK